MLGREEMLLDTRCNPESARAGGMLALAILIFLWSWQPQDGRGHSMKGGVLLSLQGLSGKQEKPR